MAIHTTPCSHNAIVTAGTDFDEPAEDDVSFTYCWPGQTTRVDTLSLETAPDSSRLLICHEAQAIRCKTMSPGQPLRQPTVTRHPH